MYMYMCGACFDGPWIVWDYVYYDKPWAYLGCTHIIICMCYGENYICIVMYISC